MRADAWASRRGVQDQIPASLPGSRPTPSGGSSRDRERRQFLTGDTLFLPYLSVPIPALVLTTALLFPAAAEVRVHDEGRTFRLENGRVSARIDKVKATLVSLKRGDLELIRGGAGYWSLNGGSDQGRVQRFPEAVEAAITRDGGNVGEVAVDCPYDGTGGTWPSWTTMTVPTLGSTWRSVSRCRRRRGWNWTSVGPRS